MRVHLFTYVCAHEASCLFTLRLPVVLCGPALFDSPFGESGEEGEGRDEKKLQNRLRSVEHILPKCLICDTVSPFSRLQTYSAATHAKRAQTTTLSETTARDVQTNKPPQMLQQGPSLSFSLSRSLSLSSVSRAFISSKEAACLNLDCCCHCCCL